MSEKLLHGQMSVVDENGEVTLIHQETSASDVLVDINSNTQGTNGSSTIPLDVKNLQELTNKLGTLAFKSNIDTSDLPETIGENLDERLTDIEESALLVGIDEEIDSELIVPESEINDEVTSTHLTWSSKKISDIAEELNNNSHTFYVRLTEDENGNYISHTTVAEIESAYISGKAIWVVASNIFIPLRNRVNNNTWIFSGYTEEQAYDVTVTSTGVTFAYKEIATASRLSTELQTLSQTIYQRMETAEESIKTINGDESTKGSIAYAVNEMKNDILGDDLTTTFDTLKAVQEWVNTHGQEATDLATAVTEETKNRKDADTKLDTRLKTLEAIDHNAYVSADNALDDRITKNTEDISAIKNGDNINSFKDVEESITSLHTHDNKDVLDSISSSMNGTITTTSIGGLTITYDSSTEMITFS